ncbi:MAG: [Clostridia bacterium]|nr:[FeFe] hydrogenase H-cluster radical SAM maturase HydE [Clostridia bacterium]
MSNVNELRGMLDALQCGGEVDFVRLIELCRQEDCARMLQERAEQARRGVYGNKVFVRGLIEVSNICKNDCYYCGIRKSNPNCERYRLSKEEILECCAEGYALGFRTFVMQGGEDGFFTDEVLCDIVSAIKDRYPDCAVTLSMGERSRESYARLRAAGADRYLLRHETADKTHYEQLHPASLSFENRMECLKNLKELGFQTGAGFMVGSPGQTDAHLAKDLQFIRDLKPEMCGIGPFIPHKDTKFRDEKAGSVETTLILLGIIRLMCPNILLPATTALASLEADAQMRAIRFGANVIMPNLSPMSVRKKYALYDGKAFSGTESAQLLDRLRRKVEEIGYEVVTDRGDFAG